MVDQANHISVVPNEDFGTVLFDGADVCVRAADHGSPGTVISFSPRLAVGQKEIWPRLGFAERALNQSKTSNIVFVARASHWWQTPEMPQALSVARAALRSNSSTSAVTYGTSMGGYGALKFANALAADEAMVFSPQFSADPKVVPEEKLCPKRTGSTTTSQISRLSTMT